MKFQPFAFLTVSLAIGVVINSIFKLPFEYLVSAAALALVLILILKIKKTHVSGITVLGLFLICILGMIRYQQVNKITLPQELSNSKQLLEVKVVDIYKPSAKYYKYKVKILRASNSNLIAENVLLYLKKNQPGLHLQDIALTHNKLSLIEPPKNPHQFNYKNFIARKGIHLQSFTDTIYQTKHPAGFNFFHAVSVFKGTIKQKLRDNGYTASSRIFISSLALGDRTNFTQEIQNTLSAAGVMHLFAISGLHIGIIFGLLLLFLYPLLYLPKGRSIRIIIALILIWFFAAFVNFTPSVTRAAFMISFYYLTFLLQRPTNIFHTLFFTAFVLLIINPNYLFDVGFQLSYAAVFFIAWLRKPIRHLLPRYRKQKYNYMFDILSVTLAAQMGVMPISIFYFNQFSALFILGNLLLIPFAVFMVGISMISAVLISLNLDFSWYVQAVNYIFNGIYWLIESIASFDGLIFNKLSISLIQLGILMAILFLLKPLLVKFKWVKTTPILILIMVFQLSRMYDKYTSHLKDELIVFNLYKGNLLGLRNGNVLDVFQKVEDSLKTYNYVIKPYILKENIDVVHYHSLEDNYNTQCFKKEGNFIKYGGNSFYLLNTTIDTLPLVDYVFAFRGNLQPYTHINMQTKRVIADASNYPSVIKRLKEKSGKIYSTANSGAYIFTIDSINH